jgi:hypothetical protein
MEDVMNRACDTYWGGDECIALVERPFERCRGRHEDNIKVDLKQDER